MRNIGRWIGLFVLLLVLWPQGCSSDVNPGTPPPRTPVVRVLLLENQSKVMIASTTPATVRTGRNPKTAMLDPSTGEGVAITLAADGWRIGTSPLALGELQVTPHSGGAIRINSQNYRGNVRLVPTSEAGHFDVVNDVDVDGYLKGVVPKELPKLWDQKTYQAQAVVARTYVLYESKTSGVGRHFDVYADQRSQVYGGIDFESTKGNSAVDSTAGRVVTFGPSGKEKIFKSYFSSCCGGVSQSVSDAFGDPWIEPLSEQSVGTLCSASPRFNWGPIVVKKDELTRRFKAFGVRLDRAEKNIGPVVKIDIAATNRFGRPVRFIVTDARGNKFSWTGEEIRWAVNTEAPEGSRLFSSYFKVVNDTDSIRFVEGHGLGHAVGLCQWCSEARAEQGMSYVNIVLSAYPNSKLRLAY